MEVADPDCLQLRAVSVAPDGIYAVVQPKVRQNIDQEKHGGRYVVVDCFTVANAFY